GLLVLSSLSAGCGLFGGNKELNASRLEVENLRGQLERAERDLDRAEDDAQDLESELVQVKSDYDELKASKPAVGISPGTRQVITVSGSVLFRAGAADLTSAGKSKLNSVAGDIRSRYPGHHISVEGHTDSTPLRVTKPKWGTNMWLSANRARAVADHLISRGIAENLVSVRGWGAGKPTGRGRDQDRRVEIIVLSR
ncbi:MAG: OmpA family protein, partial [Phycisphaerae bacterium]|nr:OmpA family protein [Phycisphaerae bacterium]